jgi:hypothetical protein
MEDFGCCATHFFHDDYMKPWFLVLTEVIEDVTTLILILMKKSATTTRRWDCCAWLATPDPARVVSHLVLSLSSKIRRQRNQDVTYSYILVYSIGQMIAASTNPGGRTTSSSQWPWHATSDPGQTRRPEQPRPFLRRLLRSSLPAIHPYSHAQETSSQKDSKVKFCTSGTGYHFPFVLYTYISYPILSSVIITFGCQ